MPARAKARIKTRRLRLKTFSIFEEAIGRGLDVGSRRAHKHTANPSVEAIHAEQLRGIMEQLGEVVDWEHT